VAWVLALVSNKQKAQVDMSASTRLNNDSAEDKG
jgi:hypothetical protein